MLDNAHQIVAGVVLLSVIGIAYGGTFLLRVFQNGVPRSHSSGPGTRTPAYW
jgi:hypothetical protein